jgi:hypothetical protein
LARLAGLCPTDVQNPADDVVSHFWVDGMVGNKAAVKERAGEEIGDDLRIETVGNVAAFAGAGEDLE